MKNELLRKVLARVHAQTEVKWCPWCWHCELCLSYFVYLLIFNRLETLLF